MDKNRPGQNRLERALKAFRPAGVDYGNFRALLALPLLTGLVCCRLVPLVVWVLASDFIELELSKK